MRGALKDADDIGALLDRPAGEAARRLALAELERAADARRALGAEDDPDALHDFRVALRRLRSQLRAFRETLGSAVPKKLARRLRRLAAASGPGRDAEVGIGWLDRLDPPATPRQEVGWRRLRERLEERRHEGLREARHEMTERFDRLATKLQDRLSAWQVDLRPESAPEALRSVVARELQAHRTALHSAFDAIAGLGDEKETHRARLEVKRMRYLLDPLAALLPAAKPALARLRALQDLLGDLNDLAVLVGDAGKLAAALESESIAAVGAGSPPRRARPRERAGLVALAERIAAARAERWQIFEVGWLGETASQRAGLDADLGSVAAALER